MRIVSLVPSITELLFAFGLGNDVVGVTRFCTQPSEARKPPRVDVGGPKTPKISKIKELQPDVIIMNKDENTYESYEQLKTISEILVTHVQSVHDVPDLMIQIAKRFDVLDSPKVQSLITQTQTTIQTIVQAVKKIPREQRPRVFTPIWKNPWMTINKTTYIHSLIETAGGINVFSEHEMPYPQISLNEIKHAAPNMVLLPSEPYCFKITDLTELQEVLPSQTRYEFIDGSYLAWYGVRTQHGLKHVFTLFSSLSS